MPTLNLGRVKAPPFVPRGAWDIGTAYVINDLVVGTSGNSYAAVADSTGEDPESALGSWVFFAAGGAAGADGTPGSDATVNATNVASVITGATEKTTPVDADQLAITDSAASGALKRLTFANLWAWITGKADSRYFYEIRAKVTGSTTATTATELGTVTVPSGTWWLRVIAIVKNNDGVSVNLGAAYAVKSGSATGGERVKYIRSSTFQMLANGVGTDGGNYLDTTASAKGAGVFEQEFVTTGCVLKFTGENQTLRTNPSDFTFFVTLTKLS